MSETHFLLCSHSPFFAPRSVPVLHALCGPFPSRARGPSRSLLALHLALRHSHSGHFLFFWPVSRGCGAALQCCRHGRRTVSPSPSRLSPVPALPLLHRCKLQWQRRRRLRRQQRPTHTIAAAAGCNYEVVASGALVHLVVRGRDIGLPRSTLPVRYSFPASLMYYTRLSASALCRCLSRPFFPPLLSLGVSIVSASLSLYHLLLPLPSSSPFFYVSRYFPFNLSSFSSIFPSPSRLPAYPTRDVSLSFSLRPSVPLSLSLYISARMRRGASSSRDLIYRGWPPSNPSSGRDQR